MRKRTLLKTRKKRKQRILAPGPSITILNPGAIANGGKIKEKTPAEFPAGIDHLMQFAISSIRDVSGVNLELLLGQAGVDQPGILEHQRKQAGMTILAGLFDLLREYRKDQGQLMLYYITNFLSDGRLISDRWRRSRWEIRPIGQTTRLGRV